MITKNRTLPRPVRRARWNDRVIVTQDGVQTAQALNTNLCPRCGCQNLREGYCDCAEQDAPEYPRFDRMEEYEANPYDGTYSEC